MTTPEEEIPKQKLKDLFKSLDIGDTGKVSRGTLWSIFEGVGIDKATAQATLEAADTNKDGMINLDLFFDWLFASPEMRRTLLASASGKGQAKTEGPLFVGTLNFLGNAYNAIEFLNADEVFMANYEKIRACLFGLTCEKVLQEAVAVGFVEADLAQYLPAPADNFETVCTKEFLGRDNKFELNLRTNMIVAGMMPTQKGPPLYQSLTEWRSIMVNQVENYKKDPQLALWDIACNLAVEGSKEAYDELCGQSYLNPDLTLRNVQTLLDKLPRNRDVVCAVQEFPERDTAKNFSLLCELPGRGLKAVKPQEENSSVGFILSASLSVRHIEHAPFGRDPEEVYRRICEVVKDLPDYKDVSDKDKESLKTTAFKTFVMDVAVPTGKMNAKGAQETLPVRFLSVHAKEFKTEEGTKLMAAYLRALALAGEIQDSNTPNAAVVLLDSNTPDVAQSAVFDGALVANGFQVLSPVKAKYTTTRKQRSQMHGQIYDKKKCLQVVQAHKTFAAMIQQPADTPVWEALMETQEDGTARAAVPCPDLAKETLITLPHRDWPTDHCMLQVQLAYKGPS